MEERIIIPLRKSFILLQIFRVSPCQPTRSTYLLDLALNLATQLQAILQRERAAGRWRRRVGSYVSVAFQFTAPEIELACLTLLGACAMENK